MKAIVVGGGLAGLAAAHRLRKANWEVILLEQASQVGGRATSSRKQGYLLEHGATQISTGYMAYLALADEIGLRDQIVDCSNVIGLLRNGKVHEIDAQRSWTAAFSGALSIRSKFKMVRAMLDFLAVKPTIDVLDLSTSHHLDSESAEAYCRRQLNDQIYDVLVDAAIRCCTLNRASQVSVLEWFGFLRNLAGQKMLALRTGINGLPSALASQLDVRLNSTATLIHSSTQGVEVSYENTQHDFSMLQADACVVATPLPQAALLAPQLQDAIKPLTATLVYNPAVVVHLGFRKRTHSNAIGVLVGAAEHSQIGLLWLEHNKLAESAPPGHSLFTVYFEAGGLDSVQPNTDARFIEIALAFVERLFPELAGECELQNVVRWQRAIANPAPGIYRAIHTMKTQLDPASRVQLAGDYLTCTGQNSAIHWGNKAADNLIQQFSIQARA